MKAEKFLREVYNSHRGGLPDLFRWEDEKDRLNELYFCLIRTISGRNEAEVRDIVMCLAGLNLFDIEYLAGAQLVGGKGGKGDTIASLIKELLVLNNFGDETAEACTLAICEVAKGIHLKYDGKLQKFLRKHANQMIDELDEAFSFSAFSKQDEHYFLAHWLQNVLEMPVPISNEFVEQFCKEKNIGVEDLIEAADKLNINVAVVDDLLKMYMLVKTE